MTMKNSLITVGFGVIVAAQFAVGMGVVTLAAKRESKAKLETRKDCVSLRASMRFTAVARVQVKRSRQYFLTHIVCA